MIDIESLIPHREPIKVITEIKEITEDGGSSTAVVNQAGPLRWSGGQFNGFD